MARLEASFHESDTRRILRDFIGMVGRSELMRITDRVRTELTRRKIVSQALRDRYAVSVGLAKAATYERSTGRPPKPLTTPELYAACIFAATAVDIARQLSPDGRNRLAGMIRDNLGLAGDLRRLQHEFTVAAHFAQRGWDLEFVDMEGRGQHDYLARKLGLEVDIECKTISGDKGNAIHQIDALNFMETVHAPLLETAKPDACWTVDITFSNSLPKSSQDQLALSDQIAKCMREGGSGVAFDGGSFVVRRDEMPIVATDERLQSFAAGVIRSLQEPLNGHAGAIFDRRHLLAIGVSSQRRSKILDYTHPEIKKGCEQLSRQRAGYVWTHFVDVSDRDMRLLAAEGPGSALDTFSTRIFREEGRRHVSALSYSGEGVLVTWQDKAGRGYNKRGALATHYSNVATFPLPQDGGFP